MKVNWQALSVIVFAIIAVSGTIYGYGVLNSNVEEVKRLEMKTEQHVVAIDNRMDDVAERLARIEGYLQNGYNARAVGSNNGP